MLFRSGFYAIETTMLALGGFDEVAVIPDAGNYLKDARTHLIATANTEAEYDSAAEEIFATYAFENLYTGADVVTTNKELEYSKATKAATGTIYAWDAEKEDYVAVKASDAFSVETLESTMTDLGLIFTDETTAGYKILEDAKLYAVKNVPNEENKEYVYEEITLDDVDTLLATIEEYNDYHNEGADYKAKLTIGTYVDEDRKTQVAYVILDWVEYDEELEAFTFAGVTK